MAFHHKGNYVLLLTLQSLRGEQLSYTIEHLLDQVYPLALDQYGICIVNKIIQLAEKEDHISQIILTLAQNITEII